MFCVNDWFLLSGYRSKPNDKVGSAGTKMVFEVDSFTKNTVSGIVMWSNNDSRFHVGERVYFVNKSLFKNWSKVVKLSFKEIEKLVLLKSL